MPRNEDGEFELVLGNKQLLSVFFIVVVLLGVFFTMGYIVGRNSAPLTEVAATPKLESKPPIAESAKQPEATKPEAPPPATPRETAPQQPPAGTQPQKQAEPVKETKKSEPKKEPEKKRLPSMNAEPVAGATYLQLIAAPGKDTCDIEVNVLRKKSFSAMAMEIPEKAGWCRVLVGPIADGAYASTKKQLLDAGFPANQAIRKTF